MLKLYKNKRQIFECKVEIEGSSYEKAKPRLILMPANDNRNIFFEGVIEGSTCKVVVTPNLDIPKTGKVMLEVVVDNSIVFQPWETTYEIIVDAAKVQSESITLTFEPSAPTVKVVENVTVKDDKNRIIEPTKPQVKIVETKKEVKKEVKKEEPKKIAEDKKSNKKSLFLDSISESQELVVNEFLNTVNSLDKKEKKALLEHISKSYKPNTEAISWAKQIFTEQSSLASKIAMYCHQIEEEKRVYND